MSSRGGFRGRGRGGGKGFNTRFQGKRSNFRPSKVAFGIDNRGAQAGPSREDDGTAAQERFEEVKVQDEIDEKMGFWRFESNLAAGESKVGWLVNMHQVSICRQGKEVWLTPADIATVQDTRNRYSGSRLLLYSGRWRYV